MKMNLFDKAIMFAIKAHEGQKRKNGGIYIVHPLEVATIAATLTNDVEVLSAAVLHDTVEDTSVKMEDILNEFGPAVAKLVSSETENKRRDRPASETWRIRKEESIKILFETDDINIKIVWLSDKLANMRSIYREYLLKGDDLWQVFNQKDPNEHYWYYSSIYKGMVGLENTPAYNEYKLLLDKVFEKYKLKGEQK